MKGPNCTHQCAAGAPDLRPFAFHAPTDVTLGGGTFVALLFSLYGIGSVWLGLFLGMLSFSIVLSLLSSYYHRKMR